MPSSIDRKKSKETFSPNTQRKQRVIAYLRVSTNQQDVDGQRLTVLYHAQKLGLVVDEIMELEISSRKDLVARRVDELSDKLICGDVLIVSELSRLGRSLAEVVSIINAMVAKGVRIIAVKQGLDIKDGKQDMAGKVMVAIFLLLAELERDLISERTKMALDARRAAGVKLGRPKGLKGHSKLDDKLEAITQLLRHRVSKSAIARMMGVGKSTLVDYVRSRRIQV